MIKNIIENYKAVKQKDGHADEFYKYEAIQHFQDNWNPNAKNFSKMFKNSLKKQYNLMYNLAQSSILKVAKKYPDETKNLFENLFDETTDLEKRIKSFMPNIDNLIKQIDTKLHGNQDERAISVYLTFRYPEKYTFFKDSFYSKLCEKLGEQKARKGKKYVHYLKLIGDIKNKYVIEDQKLWELTNAALPENAYKDQHRNILTQDILYVALDKNQDPNYWVFQCNPEQYDIFTEWQNATKSTWTVSAHKKEIHLGDKVILWVTGNRSGCYGLCTITSKILNDGNGDYVEMDIDQNLVNNAILKEDLLSLPEFSDFKGGHQGTNFTATEEQFNIILHWANHDEEKRFIQKIRKIGIEKDVRFHFSLIDLFIGKYNVKKDDKRLVFGAPNSNTGLNVTVNQRYILKTSTNSIRLNLPAVLEKKVISEPSYISHEFFKNLPGMKTPAIYVYFQKNHQIVYNYQKEWLKICEENLNYGVQSSFVKYGNSAYRKAAFDKTYREKILQIAFTDTELETEENSNQETMKQFNIPQNLILYGPPGTGKTYQLTNNYFNFFTDKTTGKSKSLFTYELTSDLSWWEVVTLCMLELEKAKVAEIVEHPLIIEKINQSKNSKPRNTIWYWLQNFTKQECPNVNVAKRNEIQIFWKDEKSVWSIDKDLTQETLPDLVDKLEQWHNYQPENKITKRYEIITFHQSYSYEEFIEGIRPDFQEQEELKYSIEKGVFLRIAEKARKDNGKPYALFIDEINRGNISKIFGELITLIEPDKRQGEENELEVTLPYSKTSFSVPPNLYIIGTMNTADRSIALIDTALRRRFHFKEMMPESWRLDDNIEGVNLQLLLEKINERIEFLLDRDHTIGHSYFMKINSRNELCAVFKNKIIPLLQEYFYNDWEKVQLVLGDNERWGKQDEQRFIRIKKQYGVNDEIKLFGFDVEDYEDEMIYEINPELKSDNFAKIPVEAFVHIYQKP